MSVKEYWDVTRKCLRLPEGKILSTRDVAKLMGISVPGVSMRMKKYHIVPTVVAHARGSGVMHYWCTSSIVAAAKRDWGEYSHLAPVTRIEAERILSHLDHIRKTHTIKHVAEICGISVNAISKWVQRETVPNIGQRKALLEKFPMVGCL